MKLMKKSYVAVALAASLLAISAMICCTNQRRYSVRPLLRKRRSLGHFSTLVKFMKNQDHPEYFKYTRMSPALFNNLLEMIQHDLQKHPYRNALSPAERLTLTLHYLSEGCSMQQIAWDYYIGKSTAHYVIKETCRALWNNLQPIYLHEPSAEEWKYISKGFFLRWNMPNCFGAVDGKHIIIQAPKYSGTDYFSYKKSFSLVLMATCDAFYKFTMVDIGAAGSNHDRTVFKNSGLGCALLSKKLAIPPSMNLSNTNQTLPHFLVADQAFPLHDNIMRPYPGKCLGERKNIFNYRLSRARRTIENTFGILAQRWRILRRPIVADISTCEEVARATVVLHNFLQRSEQDIPVEERQYCPSGFVDYMDDNGNMNDGHWRRENIRLQSISRIGSNNSTRTAQNCREALADYFQSNEGSVPWQLNRITEGALPDGF